jgi:mono/diheme cytochrome c family protein
MIGKCHQFRHVCMLLSFVLSGAGSAAAQESSADQTRLKQFVEANCLDCHDSSDSTAGLALDELLSLEISERADEWESVVRKLSTRQMPPVGQDRPSDESYDAVLSVLTSQLDRAAEQRPNPGRTDSLRRLSRTEYHNSIRDLLALEVDVRTLLPADESSHGFDNITVTGLSPTLLNRYISAAQKISRLAVGTQGRGPGSDTFRMRPDITQDDHHVPGLPLGTRGGMLIPYNFPRDGEYEFQILLMRDRNDEIEGLRGEHELELLIDRGLQASFSIVPPARGESDRHVDADLTARVNIEAGPHDVGVTFVRKPFALLESERQPLNVHYNFYRHPRLGPAVYQVTITGPFESTGAGDTPSRRRIFGDASGGRDEADARQVLMRLLRRAYRRPVTEADLAIPLRFFRAGLREGGFDVGIERALASILVNPNFLFRLERQPPELKTDQPYRISELELASRLSFFLWSSIPDDQLLDAAIRGDLSDQEELESQVRRMLSDDRSASLVTNFADQWLFLRNLESFVPDARLFPDFDHNLRQAFRRETELLFEQMLREDQSVLVLLNPSATYLNERLARHYGLSHVTGSHFRPVSLDAGSVRGGILRHGSVLSVTSYATRTSPVIRGKWILENILGSAPPPPPPNVPALDDNTVSAALPVRERLAVHRANPACASCHDVMDPVGFGLEHFDAVGRWRDLELGRPIDASGSLPDGSQFDGVSGLEQALLARPQLFVQTLTEKLMTFALGRGVGPEDAPAIRKIVRDAERDNYRFSALILGIVRSVPFQMRMSVARPAEDDGAADSESQ